MDWELILAGIVTITLLAYLACSLVYPERF
jgi:K+-transporting ATPase KdpF subunit